MGSELIWSGSVIETSSASASQALSTSSLIAFSVELYELPRSAANFGSTPKFKDSAILLTSAENVGIVRYAGAPHLSRTRVADSSRLHPLSGYRPQIGYDKSASWK